jgi:hypothetical protein
VSRGDDLLMFSFFASRTAAMIEAVITSLESNWSLKRRCSSSLNRRSLHLTEVSLSL